MLECGRSRIVLIVDSVTSTRKDTELDLKESGRFFRAERVIICENLRL